MTHERKLIPPGTRFGRLVVVALAEKRAGSNRVYLCRCDCGAEVEVVGSRLTTGRRLTRSCGCLAREAAERPIPIGARIGRLTVREKLAERRNGQVMYRCLCVCGRSADVRSRHLRIGRTTSCGCVMRDANTTHGATRQLLFGTWKGMMTRCYNPNHQAYHHYGGRGITVCDRWHDFWAWEADMGAKPSPRHTLDRIDNDGNYEPENCRWATPREQALNQRRRVPRPPDSAGVCACGRPKRPTSATCYDCRGNGGHDHERNLKPCIDCGGLASGERCRPCWRLTRTGLQVGQFASGSEPNRTRASAEIPGALAEGPTPSR